MEQNWVQKQAHTYVDNWFSTKVQRQLSGKQDSLFNKWWWNNLIFICQNIYFDPYFVPCIKLNSKWTLDINVKPKTVNLWKKTEEKIFVNMGIGKNFLKDFLYFFKSASHNDKIDKWHFTKIKSVYSLKDTVKSNKRQCKKLGENICNHISDRGLLFRNRRSSQISIIRNQKSPLKNAQKIWTDPSSKFTRGNWAH